MRSLLVLGVDDVGVEEAILGEALGDFSWVDWADVSLGFGGSDVAAFLGDDAQFALAGAGSGTGEGTCLLN